MRPNPITPEKVDELLRFLPGFEDLGQPFVVRWAGGEATEEGAVTMPYPVYAQKVDDFFRLAGQECWLDAEYLAVDPARMLDDDEAIGAATLEQVRAMLTYCVRAERFGDGSWEGLLRSGRITALLRRLQVLRSGMTESQRSSPPRPGPGVARKVEAAGAEFDARLRAAMEKAWWKDMDGLVGATDRPLAVIHPRSDATADDLRALGQALALWRAEVPQARHVWGLEDLLVGRCPRTPPTELAVPIMLGRLHEHYEPVALAYVAEGADAEAVVRDLYERLGDLRGTLAWFGSPDAYSDSQR
jgi:hypothetical protein